ncbi:hypothetical protein SDJN02_24151, partial [Cucurbita argyrosperma subsp. argyrosperma]
MVFICEISSSDEDEGIVSVCRIAMSATVLSDTILEPQAASTKLIAHMEVEFVKCYCCGLIEECTPAYIQRVRERYNEHWICGLCSEAINYEILRSRSLITAEEAMEIHMNLCKKFTALKPPPNPAVHLISAMRQILKRSLDSPSRAVRSMPTSPMKKASRPPPLARTGSCLSSLSGS